jgi:predicted O-methyltransferase YrrM
VTGVPESLRTQGRRAAKGLARLPWRAVQSLPLLPQQRVQLLLGRPLPTDDCVWSALDPTAVYDQHPSPELIDLALGAAREASRLSLTSLLERAKSVGSPSAAWVDAFPGEHYRLLAALVRVIRPRLVIEIGTYTGASALAFLEHATDDTRIVSYDLIPWDQIDGSLLSPADFQDGRLEQRLGDLADAEYWSTQRDLFEKADLIFLDGPKDNVFEPKMLETLARLRTDSGYLLVVDDIRFLEMLTPWSRFPAPRIDFTSFGHWSGTGLALVPGQRSTSAE